MALESREVVVIDRIERLAGDFDDRSRGVVAEGWISQRVDEEFDLLERSEASGQRDQRRVVGREGRVAQTNAVDTVAEHNGDRIRHRIAVDRGGER